MLNKIFIGIFLILGVTVSSQAQFQLPQIDVDVKGMLSFFDIKADNVNNTFSLSYQGGAHIQINQYFAVGGYYGKSFKGIDSYQNTGTSSSSEIPTQLLIYGGDIRLSTGRSAKWRPYLLLTYGKLEFVEQQSINLAHSTMTLGGNVGVMLRLSNNLSWNVAEVGVKSLEKEVYWLNSNLMIEARTGLTYNIRIKSK